jgi:hypothetical protein
VDTAEYSTACNGLSPEDLFDLPGSPIGYPPMQQLPTTPIFPSAFPG